MKNLFWIVPAILFLIIAVIIAFVYYTSPAHNVIDALINNNIYSAEYYYKSVDGNSIHERIFNSKLEGALTEINEKYNNNIYTYDETKSIYEAVKELDPRNEIDDSYDEFILIYNSKATYGKRLEAFSNFNYLESIRFFEKVSEKDSLYDNASNKIKEAEEKHISSVKQRFYKYILEEDYIGAQQFIKSSIEEFSSDIFIKLKENLNENVYIKCNNIMKNLKTLEHIHQYHAGESDYYCYEIHLPNENSNYISCNYVLKRFYRQVLAGTLMPSGPIAWYDISGNQIADLSYDDSKHLTNGKTIKWDCNASEISKIEILDELFS